MLLAGFTDVLVTGKLIPLEAEANLRNVRRAGLFEGECRQVESGFVLVAVEVLATVLPWVSMNRWPDWWQQASRDLEHARHAAQDQDYEWAAFAAQQSAEKTVKSVILARGGEPWGHSVTGLLEALPADSTAPREIVEAGNRLDKHYIPARYPNGFAEGFPGKLYTRGEAEGAIADAGAITEFCRRHLPE